MLTPIEANQVAAELADVLADQQDPKALFTIIFHNDAKPLLLEIPTSVNRVEELAQFALDFCVRNRWNANPSMLELLLLRLIDSHGKVQFQSMLDRVRAHIDPNPDVFAARWVLAQQPFFARTDLRRHVKELLEKNDRPVLRINGQAGSGRSYTTKFLEYIMDQTSPSVHVVPAEIPPGMGPSYELESLAGDFASQMGFNVPPRSGSSYPSLLRRSITQNAVQQTGKWLFVIEGAGQPYLNPEVGDFVHQLAKAACTGEFRRKIRLILIDYPEKIPVILAADMMEEKIPSANSIGQTDVIECLHAHNERAKALGTAEIQTPDVPVIAADIIGKAPADGKERLQHVYDELVAITAMPHRR
jgi:hypothetical protein